MNSKVFCLLALLLCAELAASAFAVNIQSPTFLVVPYNSIITGQAEPISVNALVSHSDLVEILVNNAPVAGPTYGRASYNPYRLQPGNYLITADDLTAGETESEILMVSAAPTVSMVASNALLDTGQQEVLTVYIRGGHVPFGITLENYTSKMDIGYAWINSSGATAQFSFFPNVSKKAEKISYRAFVTDNGTQLGYKFNTNTNTTITVSPAITGVVLELLNSTIAVNQGLEMLVSFSGGTPPYNYKFLISNGIGNATLATTAQSNASRLNLTVNLPNSARSLGNLTIKGTMTDSASTPVTVQMENVVTVIAQNATSTSTIFETSSILPTNQTTTSAKGGGVRSAVVAIVVLALVAGCALILWRRYGKNLKMPQDQKK